ncbi:MAG: universal stress protein, partial [Candidatus Binatia bacterium]
MEPIKKILIPLVDPLHADPYVKLGAALLPPEGRILALRIVEIPEGESLSTGAEKAPVYRAALEDLNVQVADERVELRTLVRVSHGLSEGIATTAKEEGCDLLILPWKGYSSSDERFFGATIDRLLEHPPCKIIVVRATDPSGCKRLLLPIRGGPYAEFALEVAARLASAFAGEVTVLHCEQESPLPESRDRLYRSLFRKLRSHLAVKRWVTIQG